MLLVLLPLVQASNQAYNSSKFDRFVRDLARAKSMLGTPLYTWLHPEWLNFLNCQSKDLSLDAKIAKAVEYSKTNGKEWQHGLVEYASNKASMEQSLCDSFNPLNAAFAKAKQAHEQSLQAAEPGLNPILLGEVMPAKVSPHLAQMIKCYQTGLIRLGNQPTTTDLHDSILYQNLNQAHFLSFLEAAHLSLAMPLFAIGEPLTVIIKDKLITLSKSEDGFSYGLILSSDAPPLAFTHPNSDLRKLIYLLATQEDIVIGSIPEIQVCSVQLGWVKERNALLGYIAGWPASERDCLYSGALWHCRNKVPDDYCSKVVGFLSPETASALTATCFDGPHLILKRQTT